jgi:hypothetical protein
MNKHKKHKFFLNCAVQYVHTVPVLYLVKKYEFKFWPKNICKIVLLLYNFSTFSKVQCVYGPFRIFKSIWTYWRETILLRFQWIFQVCSKLKKQKMKPTSRFLNLPIGKPFFNNLQINCLKCRNSRLSCNFSIYSICCWCIKLIIINSLFTRINCPVCLKFP